MKILDCTLRDGGYYNNWDFDPVIVEAYLNAAAAAKIDYIELGLRNFVQKGFVGAYAYTTEQHLTTLELPEGPIYGVMIDAKTILSAPMDIEEAVDALFVPAAKSKIDLVRVAAHFHEVEKSEKIVKKLKSLGYIVGYNLMQAGGKPDNVIAHKAQQVKGWGVVDVLYFADSLGSMDGNEVRRIINALRKHWGGSLGIHTHNNMGKGLENTLAAHEAGVDWLDVTITGMGRGAGNTPTEYLLAILDKKSSHYQAKPIYELVIRYFESMQKKYGWGASLLYFLGAQNDIHPTYIQNLLSNTHYGTDEIVGALDYLSQLDGTTAYNGSVLDTALTFSNAKIREIGGSLDVKGIFKGRDVLVLANGPSTLKYSEAICQYIRYKKPVVLSVNIIADIPTELVDFYVISHNSKFFADASKYKTLTQPIILPKNRLNIEELNALQNNTLLDYGLDIKTDTLEVNDTYVISPHDLTAAYVFAVLISGQAGKVTLAGFDGYEKGDRRQQEMISILTRYKQLMVLEEFEAITPTTYPIAQGSVYAIHA
ncbi:aldolase catalytic domain-containing protein [Pectobacterium versatile]|uniref:aldolase catalytic domain-containing protein n=1 Tax=Pectobacterium versatile TaxID=2488639 RepID=UPI00195F2D2F|nr:aldolase catalytic domain-containing protein [Pectobacterium versatile]